ncbi:MAG: oligosaccharide flippase family protein [Anaerolineae bacterium]|nr:oligosaccharide flippase family protein [Anaerolineae bacterium]
MSLAQRTINNSISNVIGWGWATVLSLVATRYIVQGLGREAYGILALALTVIGYFAILDLGLNTASVKYIAEYYVKQDLVTLNKIVWTTLLVFTMVGVIGGIAIILLADNLVVLFQVTPDLVSEAKFTFYVTAIGFPLSLMVGVVASIPNALQRYDLSNKLGILITTLSTLFILGLLALGYRLKAVVILQVSTTIISLILYTILSKRLIPELSWWPSYDWQIFKKLLSFGIYTFISRVGGLFLFQFDRLMIGILLGASLVTYYVVPLNLATQLHKIVLTIAGVLFPVSSGLSSTGQIETLKGIYERAIKVTLFISTFVCVTIFSFSSPILRIWIDTDFAQTSTWVLKLLTLGWYFISWSIIAYIFLDGFGKPHLISFSNILTAIVNVTAVLVLVPRYGIIGAAIAGLLYLHTLAFIYYVEKNLLHLNSWRLFHHVYLKIWFAGLVIGIIDYLLLPFTSNFLNLICIVTLGGGVYLLVVLVLGIFDERDKKIAQRYLHQFFHKEQLEEVL